MESASERYGSSWVICRLPIKNHRFLRVRSFVCLVPDVLLYSQLRIAKKKAPITNWLIALSMCAEPASLHIFRNIDAVRAFWGVVDGSRLRYPLYCQCRTMESWWSLS